MMSGHESANFAFAKCALTSVSNISWGKEAEEVPPVVSKRTWQMVTMHYGWLAVGLFGAMAFGATFPLWGLLLAKAQSNFYDNLIRLLTTCLLFANFRHHYCYYNQLPTLTARQGGKKTSNVINVLSRCLFQSFALVTALSSISAMNYSLDKAGFGICGHKNSYTSKVYDGNWSEDKIATELLLTRQIPTPSYQTEQRGNFQNPSNIPEDPRMATIKLESIDDIRAKNKEGLSYSLIFDHGVAPESPKERFKTQYQAAADESTLHYAQAQGTLRERKLQEAEDERFDSVHMTTMSRKASQRLNTSPPKTAAQLRVQQMKDDLKPETLPKWHRRSVR